MLRSASLTSALRVSNKTRMAVVGAGGKTTLIFRLARELTIPVIVSASSHLLVEQASLADHHFIIHDRSEIEAAFRRGIEGVTLFTGPRGDDQRLAGLSFDLLDELADIAEQHQLAIFVEADGSRRLPLKAPALHEPPIPTWVNHVVVVAGLQGVNRLLNGSHVHRPEIFARISQVHPGETISPQAVIRVLLDPLGGLKNIPPSARRSVVLNQADDLRQQALAGSMARTLLDAYDTVLVTSLQDFDQPVKGFFTPVAGILLAAGESSRMGSTPKVLLDWQGEPFVRSVASTALGANLKPVVIVTGAHHDEISGAVAGLPVKLAHNPDWQKGQSTSIQRGLQALPENTGAVLFLLADQPQITPELITALVQEYQGSLNPIVAPLVDGRRSNPVLFDCSTFDPLMRLEGDVGGRAIFSQYQVDYLPWHDGLLNLDVDTPEDYQRLKDAYASRFES